MGNYKFELLTIFPGTILHEDTIADNWPGNNCP